MKKKSKIVIIIILLIFIIAGASFLFYKKYKKNKFDGCYVSCSHLEGKNISCYECISYSQCMRHCLYE